ncbi:MAG: hypothetical protein SCALA702_19750 [Melioribacteraceae bacterium]|nr:MAG: hypothetical protein SCALA702_19750 [Melioribacteraceae bacterium]
MPFASGEFKGMTEQNQGHSQLDWESNTSKISVSDQNISIHKERVCIILKPDALSVRRGEEHDEQILGR